MEEAISILREIVRNIPETAYGVERQMLIGDLATRESQEERTLIKRMFDGFLLRMSEITASDIDLGGTGTRRQIWYRIHGVKKPDPSLPALTFDEGNVRAGSRSEEHTSE